MIQDSKKVATMVNVLARAAVGIRAEVAKMQAVRTAFVTHNPDVTGTPLENSVAAINTALNDLKAQSDSPVWDDLIGAVVETHRGVALDG